MEGFFFEPRGTTMMDWSTLPKDLLQSIAKFLESHFDFLHFRSVCTDWRSSAPLNLRYPPNFCSSIHYHTDKYEHKHFLWKRTVLLFKFLADGVETETPKFWLVRLNQDKLGEIRFFNPLYWGKPVEVNYPFVLDTTKVHVQELGRQYVKIVDRGDGHGPTGICLISYMNVCPSVDDRFILFGKDDDVVTYEQKDYGALIFRNFGGEELSRIEVEGFNMCEDFIHFERKCYATDYNGNTICVDPFSGISFPRQESSAVVREVVKYPLRPKYLVELCGNLLLVKVRVSVNVASPYSFEVLQLDEERKRWDPVVSLGDAILFVGRFCKFSIPCIPGVKGNCVVFTFVNETFVFCLSRRVIVSLNDRPDLLQLFSPPSF